MPPVAPVLRGARKRPPHGLVKILCLPYERKVQERYDRRPDCVVSAETLLGVSSWVDSMYVWFPAAWMPLVVDAVRAKNVWWDRLGNQQGAVAFVDPRDAPLPETRELKYKYKKWPMDEEGHSPILDVRANVDWLTLDRCLYAEGLYGMASCFACPCGCKPPAPGRPGCRKLACISQTEAEHVATTDEHAYSRMQFAHSTGSDEG